MKRFFEKVGFTELRGNPLEALKHQLFMEINHAMWLHRDNPERVVFFARLSKHWRILLLVDIMFLPFAILVAWLLAYRILKEGRSITVWKRVK